MKSNIKDIYIKLNSFKYEHSQMDSDNSSNSFIGRKKILSRIKSIITSSDINKGAYLITGQRGMGKTSVVNTAFNELVGSFNLVPLITIILLSWILWTIVNYVVKFFFGIPIFSGNFWGGQYRILYFFTILFCSLHWHRMSSKPFRTSNIYSSVFVLYILSIIVIIRGEDKLILKIIFISILYTISIFLYQKLKKTLPKSIIKNDSKKIGNYLKYLIIAPVIYIFIYCFIIYIRFTYLLLPILVLIIPMYKIFSKLFNWSFFKRELFLETYLQNLVVNSKAIISKYYTYSNILKINVNLGQSNIKQIDILRIIVNNTYLAYSKWLNSFNYIKRLLKIFIILIFSIILCTGFYGEFRYNIDHLYYSLKIYKVYPSYIIQSSSSFSFDTGFINNNSKFEDFKNTTILFLEENDKKYQFVYENAINEFNVDFNNYRNCLNFNTLNCFQSTKTQNESPKKINSNLNQVIDLNFLNHGLDSNDRDLKYRDSLFAFFSFKQIASDSNLIKYFTNKSNIDLSSSYVDQIFRQKFKNYLHNELIRNKLYYLDVLENYKLDNDLYSLPFLFFQNVDYKIFYNFLKFKISLLNFKFADIDWVNSLNINYFILLLLLLVYFLIFKIIRPHQSLLATNHKALKVISELNDRIQGDISMEQKTQLGLKFFRFPFFSRGKRSDMDKLDEIGIQNYLIEFLEIIDKIPGFFFKPKIVFVLDELDKIDPNVEDSTAKERYNPEMAKVLSSRKRQEFIIHTLSSMKYFFTTSKAKFIFVAGFEMYEAALSGVSDRENQIEGLFSQVINVNSFYTDYSDNRSNDITSMCELFVLNNFEFRNEENNLSLSSFYQDLEFNNNTHSKERITLILQNFIIYLTYRCNGSPKKLKSLFEECIVKPIKSDNFLANSIVIDCFGHGDYYLHLNYYGQYAQALTASLFMPYLMSVSQYIHEMSDKLLVSTSFIMDHIYKFHNNAFAWRHLEINPELIAYNKTPDLRKFLNDIIIYLSKNHIREVNNGLFDFKFTKKMQSEINFLCRISEKESAAFSFSMDQSIELKKYYITKLNDFNSMSSLISSRGEVHVNSVSYINMILGDLFYYDQEYDESILYYSNAIQILRNISPNDLSPYNALILTRNMLKLGLSFERKKIFDSALMVYAQIAHLVNVGRFVKLDSLKLQEFKIYLSEWETFYLKHVDTISRLFNDFTTNNTNNPKQYFENLNSFLVAKNKKKIIIENGYFTIIGSVSRVVETTEYNLNGDNINSKTKSGSHWQDLIDFICFKEHFFENSIENSSFSPDKSEMFVRVNIDEHLKIASQAVLAKLATIEKAGIHGITELDLKKTIEEFDYLIRPINEVEKPLMRVHFYYRISNILFYKSNTVSVSKSKLYLELALRIIFENKLYFNFNETIDINHSFIFSLLEYTKQFLDIVKLDHNNNNGDKEILIFLNILSAYSDILILELRDKQQSIDIYQIEKLFKGLFLSQEISEDNCLVVLYLQYVCRELFHHFGFYNQAYSSSLRLIHILGKFKIENIQLSNIGVIRDNLLNSALLHIHQMYEHSNRLEYIKYRQTFKHSESYEFKSNFEIFNNSSSSSEIKEVLLIFYDLVLKNCSNISDLYIQTKNSIMDISFCDSVIGKFNLRLIELRILVKINMEFLNRKPYKLWIDDDYNDNIQYLVNEHKFEENENLINLFSELIYLNSELIKISNIYGINYINISHSTIADSNEKMGIILEALFLHSSSFINSVKRNVCNSLDVKEVFNFNPWYHYEKAIEKYYDVLSFHSDGLVFKEFIQNQFYLEDDLNDSALHFCVAYERQKVSSGNISGKIRSLINKIDNYGLYSENILSKSK